MVTHGHPRTATTLLFNMVAVTYFLYLQQNEPDLAPALNVKFRRRGEGGKFLRHVNSLHVVKTHSSVDEFLNCNATIFTTAMDRKEAAKISERLSQEGHAVAFVQDMESLKEIGIPGLVRTYIKGFGLSKSNEEEMIKYFSNWELLRQCCGKQMSSRWRNDLFPEHLKNKQIEPHPTCKSYNIDNVEKEFMGSKLFQVIEEYPNVRPLNKPSLLDGALNGTYCSSYNNLVQTKGVYFWGTEGGRNIRSKLELSIKNEFNIGIENLPPQSQYLLLNSTYRDVWKLSKEDQEAWIEKVQSAREQFVSMEKRKRRRHNKND